MSVVVYPIVPVLASALTYSRYANVPIRYACPLLPPNYMSLETDGWNCNLCQGVNTFYQPYVKGDIIPFQTHFTDNYNSPPDTIIVGFKSFLTPINYYVKVELIDGTGTVYSDTVDEFCDEYWVGYSEKTGSVQTWFVNTGLLPADLKCWKLRITYYTPGPVLERTIWTQEYKEVGECDLTVKLQSTYANFDCYNNFYEELENTLGNSTTPYYNSLRIYGEVEQVGIADSVETNDRDVITSRKNIDKYAVISGLVPEYYYQKIANTVRGKTVNVNGIQYTNFEMTDRPAEWRMFPADITFQNICIDNTFKTCNF